MERCFGLVLCGPTYPTIPRRHAFSDANMSSTNPNKFHVALTSLSQSGVWLVRRRAAGRPPRCSGGRMTT